LRAEGYPNDIKFLLPSDMKHHGEVEWGCLENSIDDHRFECELLNEPDQDQFWTGIIGLPYPNTFGDFR